MPWFLVAFTVGYLAVLRANPASTDATGRLDARSLAPLDVVAILLVVPALHRLNRRPWPWPAPWCLPQVAGAAVWTAGGLTDDSIRRRGYTAAAP